MTDETRVIVTKRRVYELPPDQQGQPVEVIRIISARPADRTERRRYEQENR